MTTQPRPGLRDMEPYTAPQFDVPVRLNTNECPYPLPEGFARDLADAVRRIAFNRYPDREAVALRHGLARWAGHDPSGTWAANGSNEVIQQLLLAYGGPGRRAVVFEPTYGLHRRLAWIAGTEVQEIRLDEPFDLTLDHARAAARARPDVVFVCSPNNPTGGARSIEVVDELAGATAALVIVDEAYIEFGGTSSAGLLASRPNLVVVRTFSKAFALAAARIGYCLASPEVVEDLRRVRLPYHLSALTQAAGLVALAHSDEAMAILGAVRGERERLVRALAAFDGLTAFPSEANFVLFRPPRPAAKVWQGLLDRGVLVRDLSDAVPGCLRVSVGTPDEDAAFLAALADTLDTADTADAADAAEALELDA